MSAIPSFQSVVSTAQAQQARARGGRPPRELQDQLKQFAASNGITGSDYNKLQSQVNDAVAAAVKNPGQSGNPRQNVQDAVKSVLEKNGLDANAFEAQLKQNAPPGGPHGPHGKPPAGGNPGGPSGIDPKQLEELLESRAESSKEKAQGNAGEQSKGTIVDQQA
ncbi:MAG: hypothetical protein ACK5UW_06335 [bacterium]